MQRFSQILIPNLLVLLCFIELASAVSVRASEDKKTALATVVGMANSETLPDGIIQSEEERNKQTFQVARVVIKAAPEAVFKVFTDYDRAPEIFSYVKDCRIISTTPKKQIWFAATAGLLKFEYILEFKEYPPNLIEWHRVSGSFKANEGYWKFDPIENGRSTIVTYSKYVEAGFPIPQFLVKKELRDDMPKILTELKKSVENPTKYSLN